MRFYRAHSIDEALELLSEWGEDGCLLAGGTDLMAQYGRGEIAPGALIHIEGIEQLSIISSGTRTQIGALTSHRELAADAEIAAGHPALASAAGLVGGWQTQAAGSLGGNICNASPAADLAPPLLVADAHVTLTSKSGERRLALNEFFMDRRATARRPDELLTVIGLEPLPPGSAECYLKLGRRGAMDVAIVGLAVRLSLAGDGAIKAARVAVCSVAATPRRVPEVEAALTGTRIEPDALAEAGRALAEAASPIDDARGTASYRRRVLPGLLERAVMQCGEEIGR
ncbi:MAG: xanthine dehydrogenase family protein subunit M [Rhodospirillaceae bacterium]|nr:xanthine dehydrogenase family protein subunit M [Rhodospirillaceae bacterium]MBT5191677.1 xanthine dehydrogenase family protein subunit M [Rhodospirillaceae bacterium]MBT5895027.1 xanthine dehydrogenase family protein subunit M [Rhodospirillaceae bacterium]MBT6430578.1 xanthine dehydrogenase family protein subunit M [Rhodospirillaceae bacterium]